MADQNQPSRPVGTNPQFSVTPNTPPSNLPIKDSPLFSQTPPKPPVSPPSSQQSPITQTRRDDLPDLSFKPPAPNQQKPLPPNDISAKVFPSNPISPSAGQNIGQQLPTKPPLQNAPQTMLGSQNPATTPKPIPSTAAPVPTSPNSINLPKPPIPGGLGGKPDLTQGVSKQTTPPTTGSIGPKVTQETVGQSVIKPPSLPLKSLIRTMDQDISALKKGQAPAGVGVQRVQTDSPSQETPQAQSPRMPGQPMELEIGKIQKAKPLSGSVPASIPKIPPRFDMGSAEKAGALEGIKVPPPNQGSSGRFVVWVTAAVLFLAIAGGAIWFFFLRGEPPVVVESTPTPAPSATPVPIIETVFDRNISVSINSDQNFFSYLASMSASDLFNGNSGLYKVFNQTDGKRASFADFSSGGGILAPASLLNVIEEDGFYALMMRKTNGQISRGWLVKLKNPNLARSALIEWEKTMPNDLKNIFGIDPTKTASTVFLENAVSYPGTPIKYQNFPTPDLTIDYSIITLSNGENYLAFTNSKEHIFSVIERLIPSTSITPSPSSF